MILLALFAFLAGFVTVLSPCILPVLPIVLSSSVSGGHRRPLGIVTGFIVSFSLFTLFLATLVKATGISADLLRTFSVAIIILFGASLLIPKFQVVMEKLFSQLSTLISTSNNPNKTGFSSGLLLGASLGLIWTPCVGPIIASVIALAASNSVNGSAILITFAYAMGTAIPLFAITYGGRQLLQKVPWLLKNTGNIQKGFGIVMILVAVGIFFNLDRQFQTFILDKFPQYGAGLTKLEDNRIVKDSLSSLRPKSSEQENGTLAPELIAGGEWFNSPPLKIGELKGKVVLIDFWTYTCINCIRTFPYLRDWYDKYKDAGFVIIGVHSPEFEFEKNKNNLQKAIQDFMLTYPIMQDNEFDTWNAYSNQYWPAHYLINKDGEIVYTHFGEGEYDKTEEMIQKLLRETGANVTNSINNPSYKNESLSPETYLGYARLGNFASPEVPRHDRQTTYTLPQKLELNQFALSGLWNINEETAMPSEGSQLEYHFKAKEVFLVINTTSSQSQIKVYLDGKPISTAAAGIDVKNGVITVDSNKLYRIVKLDQQEDHILRLEFLDDTTSIFAFTFG